VRLVVACAALAVVAVVPASRAASQPAPPLATLLARHVPILVLHPAERFRPVPVDGFLADSDLQRRAPGGWEVVGGSLPADGAALRLDQRLCSAIDGPAATPCYAAAEAVHGSPPVVYGKAFRTRKRVDLQYWIWYPFNDYSSTVPPGDVWQAHEGDWESISVILDLDGAPLTVALSKHCAGTRRAWSGVRRRGPRPLIYVALGSHANYFAPGIFRHSPACWPRELRDVVRALELVDRTGAGRAVRPTLWRVTASRPAWMRFAGTWGERAYVHFPNNDPIAYGDAPRGPAFHDAWRSPVVEELSWPRG
jgi:hypothetical protein